MAVHAATGFPRVELEIAGERLGFLLDTGASYSMISEAVYLRWAAKHPEWSTTAGAHGYAQMTGAAFEGAAHMIRVPEATSGAGSISNLGFFTRPEGTFEQYMSAWMTAPIVGALAGNALRHLNVVIDYDQQQIGLTPARVDAGNDLNTLGLGLRRDGRRWIIQAVSDTASQARALVQLGDEILSANGVALPGLDLTGAVDALRGEIGAECQVQIRRGRVTHSGVLPVVSVLG